MSNKKGSASDLILIVGAVTIFAIMLLIGFRFMTGIDDKVQTMPIFNDQAKATSSQIVDFYPNVLDKAFLFVLIGLSVVALVFASLVRIHPVFIGLFFVVYLFIIVASATFSNVYQDLSASDEFAPLASQMRITSLIMGILPLIIGAVGILLMVVMYKTWSIQ